MGGGRVTTHPTIPFPRTEALARLGISEMVLKQMPQITPELRMIAKTIRKNGGPYGPGADLLKSWPNYLRSSDDPDALKVRSIYYELPNYLRRQLPVEAFCLAAGVSPHRVLEILTATVMRLGAQASSIIAAVNHPRVVEKTVEMALTDDGIEDRTMLHKHAGFLPTASGPKTNIVVTHNAAAPAEAAWVAAPPPEQTIRRLADRFNLSRAIPEQVTEPMPQRPVEAELVEVEREDDE